MDLISSLGLRTYRRLNEFGDFCRFSGRSLSWLFRGGLTWRGLRLLMPQFYEVGTRSIPVIMITGTFVGMVLAVQAVMQLNGMGMEGRIGTIVNLSVLRELGPVLAGFMLAGRVGGGLAAELGTMRVTEQIDALRAMGADPLRVLVVPRFLACTLMIPVLVLYVSFMGILGGYVISVHVYQINGAEFWQHSSRAINYYDMLQGPVKSVFFGAVIGLISCYKGFRCAAGAAGVGRACNESFVDCCMTILALDLFVGMALSTIDILLHGARSIL